MSEGSRYPFDELNSTGFEKLCVDLLARLGYQNVEWRKGTSGESSGADGGYDIEAILPRTDPDGHTWQERWFIECKQRRTKPLRYAETDDLRALHEKTDVLLIMYDGELTLRNRQLFDDWREGKPRTRLQIWPRHYLEKLYDQLLRPATDGAESMHKAFLEASDRTSHEKPSTRRSAFTVLERLGIAEPDLRQGVIDEICHYLRAPARQEPEESRLRLHLQDILRRRLTAWDENDEPTDDAWTGMTLDLSGAELTDFTFPDGSLRRADFTGTRFAGFTNFQGTRFEDRADFSNASFTEEAIFAGCKFSLSGVDFSCANFYEGGIFGSASFEGLVDFSGAQFTGETSFLRAQFSRSAFMHTVFRGGVTCEGAIFAEDAYFTGADFGSMGYFGEACPALNRWKQLRWSVARRTLLWAS